MEKLLETVLKDNALPETGRGTGMTVAQIPHDVESFPKPAAASPAVPRPAVPAPAVPTQESSGHLPEFPGKTGQEPAGMFSCGIPVGNPPEMAEQAEPAEKPAGLPLMPERTALPHLPNLAVLPELAEMPETAGTENATDKAAQPAAETGSGEQAGTKGRASGRRPRRRGHRAPRRARTAVVPFFIPFAGCPHRCIYCAQDKQTGLTVPASAEACAAALVHFLYAEDSEKTSQKFPEHFEFAFYGGTFTALPEAIQLRMLAMLEPWRKSGQLRRIRCSTRPDALSPALLRRLKDAGLDMVELGIQTFADEALALSHRGYGGKTAVTACHMVREAGLKLGIQLLPGLPGVSPDVFLADVDRALGLHPACMRFYPCLVVRGTPLAALWQAGKFAPWDERTTVRTLGLALARAWAARTAVIRLGLAPEKDLDENVLAGPRHPALGNLIQAEALWVTLSPKIREIRSAASRPVDPPQGLPSDAAAQAAELYLPAFCQGFLYGDRGILRARWEGLGITPDRIHWIDGSEAFVIPSTC